MLNIFLFRYFILYPIFNCEEWKRNQILGTSSEDSQHFCLCEETTSWSITTFLMNIQIMLKNIYIGNGYKRSQLRTRRRLSDLRTSRNKRNSDQCPFLKKSHTGSNTSNRLIDRRKLGKEGTSSRRKIRFRIKNKKNKSFNLRKADKKISLTLIKRKILKGTSRKQKS